METKTSLIVSLFENIEVYVETNIELFKLRVIRRLTNVISSLISSIVFLIFIILTVLMLNIGSALWLGEVTGKIYYGFFILALVYALIGAILYFFRERLVKKPISNFIIVKLQKEN